MGDQPVQRIFELPSTIAVNIIPTTDIPSEYFSGNTYHTLAWVQTSNSDNMIYFDN